MSLPVLDLYKYTRGNAQEQEQFSQDLLSSFQAHGFVKLVNHGFEPDYIDELMDWVGNPVPFKGGSDLMSLPHLEPSVLQIRCIHQSLYPQPKRCQPPTRL